MIDADAVRSAWRGGARARRLLAGTARILVRTAVVGCLLTATLAAAVPAIARVTGHRVMVVVSGSMEPEIHVGDAVLVKPREGARVDDVITYRAFGATSLTTHRIVAIREIKGETYYQTKGDANDTPDPDLAGASSVVGVVGPRLPGAGWLIEFATSREGRLLILGLPALALVSEQGAALLRAGRARRAGTGHPRLRRGRRRFLRSALATAVFLAVLATPVIMAAARQTAATFVDSAPVSGNSFSTATTFP